MTQNVAMSHDPEDGDGNMNVADQDVALDLENIVEDNTCETRGMWSRFKHSCANAKAEASHLRWRVAILAGLIGFGTFYQMDIPGVIGMEDNPHTIQQHFAKAFPEKKNAYTYEMNQLLYSVLFYPNIVIPLITGVLIDRVIGPCRAVLLFTFINFIGTTIFATGIATTSYPTMVAGRFIAGCTQETIMVLRALFVARFFKASDGIKGISLAFGTAVCVTRFGSLITVPATPYIAESLGVPAAGFFGSLVTFLSFLFSVVLVLVDRHAVKNKIITPIHHKDAMRMSRQASPNQQGPMVLPGTKVESSKICGCIPRFENPFTLHQFTSLPLCFWMVCCTYNFFLPAVFPFFSYAKSFFEMKWGLSIGEAVASVTSYHLMSCVSSIFGGVIVDAVGRNAMFLVATAASAVVLHTLLTATMIPPIAVMLIYGTAHGIFLPTVQSCIPMVVPEVSMGVGIGIIGAANNLYLGIVPLMIGYILDANTPKLEPSPKDRDEATSSSPQILLATVEGYHKAQYIMIALTVLCFTFSVLLVITDKWRNRGLCSSTPKGRTRIYREVAAEALTTAEVPEVAHEISASTAES